MRDRKQTPAEPIAVTGLGCRFPKAEDPDAFWRLLTNGVDATTEVPPDRWDVDGVYHPIPRTAGKMCTRRGGFLDRYDEFDPIFFKIMPIEAARMDPQHRLVLEVAWEALESACIDPSTLGYTRTGVFVGLSHSDHDRLLYRDRARINGYNGPDTYHCFAANRLSYFLNVRGPSMSIDAACSSSLVTVHMACQSLRSGESDLALAGGVNLNLTPEEFIALSFLGVLAPDGRSKPFDARADGYGRGEGCGMVVLKRLADAEDDGDTIMAVIRGSAINHNGLSNGITAPNGTAQEQVFRDALFNAGVEAGEVSYIEAQGTGTAMGDSIEIAAMRKVYLQRCLVGSVKSNIGHLEAASGIAGLIKVILALRHRRIPPHLHFQELNRGIPPGMSYVIPVDNQAWPERRRIAGVSAFGFGGANAHLLVEEAPAPAEFVDDAFGPHLLPLSAKSAKALRELAGRYAALLAAEPDVSLDDLCFSAATGRAHFEHRLALEFQSADQLRDQIERYAAEGTAQGLSQGKAVRGAVAGTSESLAAAYVRGVPVNWRERYRDRRRRKLQLPLYPFQRQRCRFE
ncbi:MAG: beta-ketoacyl synthase N-terminal-like domain-containing protein [Bryobacteraceae bacterium]